MTKDLRHTWKTVHEAPTTKPSQNNLNLIDILYSRTNASESLIREVLKDKATCCSCLELCLSIFSWGKVVFVLNSGSNHHDRRWWQRCKAPKMVWVVSCPCCWMSRAIEWMTTLGDWRPEATAMVGHGAATPCDPKTPNWKSSHEEVELFLHSSPNLNWPPSTFLGNAVEFRALETTVDVEVTAHCRVQLPMGTSLTGMELRHPWPHAKRRSKPGGVWLRWP